MNIDFKQHLPSSFADSSRAWIYQSNRLFSISEAFELEVLLQQFVTDWKSHSDDVKGYANLFFGQFVVLLADESNTSVSGCSTDSSVRLIKEIEQKFGVQLFERQTLAFIVKDKIELLPLSQLNYAIENDFINADTLYFNNLVQTKKELEEKWIIAIKDSWLAKRLSAKID